MSDDINERCVICGLCRAEHHEYVPPRRPIGCCCDPGTWEDPGDIPPACEAHVGPVSSNCERCEHDYECHTHAIMERLGSQHE